MDIDMLGTFHVMHAAWPHLRKPGAALLNITAAQSWMPTPGPVEGTEGMLRLAPTPDAVQAWTEAVPLRRFARKDDIARAALWLCSAEAAYVTGVVLSVDGGLALGGSSAVARAMAG
jgi:NAD(P)-dependent dehydrogenase (short-subunit alcohol dehydrogenase family)